MVFRNFAGRIVWWRIIIVVIILLVVLVYFLFPDLLGLGKKPVAQPAATLGGVPQEPEIDPSLFKPFSGTALDGSYECGTYYCIKVGLNQGGEYIVVYPKSFGSLSKGMPLMGSGVFGGGKIEHVTLQMLMDQGLLTPGI